MKAGITILDVKVIGICSKCRTLEDEVSKNKYGVPYLDKDIKCIKCQFK
jgi:hypothetical protein